MAGANCLKLRAHPKTQKPGCPSPPCPGITGHQGHHGGGEAVWAGMIPEIQRAQSRDQAGALHHEGQQQHRRSQRCCQLGAGAGPGLGDLERPLLTPLCTWPAPEGVRSHQHHPSPSGCTPAPGGLLLQPLGEPGWWGPPAPLTTLTPPELSALHIPSSGAMPMVVPPKVFPLPGQENRGSSAPGGFGVPSPR